MNKEIEARLQRIEQRNSRVELDKAWETSWTRRLSITLLTYVIVVIYLKFVVHIDPLINALVPVIGFVLSTMSISVLKKVWQARQKQ